MERVSQDIKQNEYKQLYLIFGEEEYLCNSCKNDLLKGLGALEDTMNFTVFEGRNISEDKIIDCCNTMPFFADRRIVLVEDSGFFKEKCERLADYVKNLPEYVVMIFYEREVDKRSKLYKAAQKYERVIQMDKLKEDVLKKWIGARLKKNGKAIKTSTMELFIEGCGTDMNFIIGELEKLIAYSGERTEVTADDVRSVCTIQVENRIFDMIEAASRGRREDALKEYYNLLLLKEPPMKILILLERQFDQMLRIRGLADMGMGEKLITEKLKIHPYVVKKNLPIARRYNIRELKKAVEDYLQAEEDVKTGKLSDRMSVEMMLIKHSK